MLTASSEKTAGSVYVNVTKEQHRVCVNRGICGPVADELELAGRGLRVFRAPLLGTDGQPIRNMCNLSLGCVGFSRFCFRSSIVLCFDSSTQLLNACGAEQAKHSSGVCS